MPEQAEVLEWRGCEVVDQDGDKVGKLDEIYLDRESGKPEWAVVTTGLFGRKASFVPVKEALREGDIIRVPYQKDLIKEAPNVDPDGEISPEEEQRVYAHYGLQYSQADSGSGLPEGEAAGTTATGGDGSGTSAATGVASGTTSAAGSGGSGMSADGTSSGTSADSGPSGAAAGSGAGGTQPSTSGDGESAAAEPASRLRLQRVIREDVHVGQDDEVVERRTIEEEQRLNPESADEG